MLVQTITIVDSLRSTLLYSDSRQGHNIYLIIKEFFFSFTGMARSQETEENNPWWSTVLVSLFLPVQYLIVRNIASALIPSSQFTNFIFKILQ